MARISISKRARDQLESLDPPIQERMTEKLRQAGEYPEHFLEPLTGYHYYKVRAGDYRAIVEWQRNTDQLRVHAVGHRSTIYDRFSPP